MFGKTLKINKNEPIDMLAVTAVDSDDDEDFVLVEELLQKNNFFDSKCDDEDATSIYVKHNDGDVTNARDRITQILRGEKDPETKFSTVLGENIHASSNPRARNLFNLLKHLESEEILESRIGASASDIKPCKEYTRREIISSIEQASLNLHRQIEEGYEKARDFVTPHCTYVTEATQPLRNIMLGALYVVLDELLFNEPQEEDLNKQEGEHITKGQDIVKDKDQKENQKSNDTTGTA